MEPNEQSLDRLSLAALVVRAIDDLDASSEEQRDALLCELQFIAWGSIQAQNQ
jgi:hypothetical protein